MTINTTSVSTGPYIGTNTTDTYAYDFKVQLSSEIVVTETNTVGAESVLVEGTHYSVTGVGDNGGGNVVRTAGNLPSSYEWLISRATPITQLADFPGQGAFTPESHEFAFDKLTSILQERAKVDDDLQDAIDNFEADPGPEGPAGPAIPGPAGGSGPPGETLEILSGIVYPPDTIGVLGQLYININTGDLYSRETADWVFLINLMGPSGSGTPSDHGSLSGLADPDHPISAIQNLEASLSGLTALIGSTFADAPVIYRQTTEPTGDQPTGALWFDSDNGNRLYYYDGANWIDVHEAEIDAAFQAASEALAAASNAQATADGKVVTFVGPSPPAADGVGDIWMDTDDGNKLYRWSGTAWVVFQDQAIITALNDAALAQSTADGKIVTFYQPSTPATGTAGVGDLWIDTDDNNHPYRYNGATWTSIRDGNIAQTASDLADLVDQFAGFEATIDGVVNIYYEATGPTVGTNPELSLGDLWIDSDDNQTYRWNGSAWVSIQDAGLAAAITDSSNAIAIADQKIRLLYQDGEPDPGVVAIDTGDLWIDTNDDNKRYRWNGSAWIDVNATLGATNLNIVDLSDISLSLGEVNSGIFRGGQTAYATGDGFWLGLDPTDADTPKFSIGDTTSYLRWDGAQLTVLGNVIVGDYIASNNTIASALTERSVATWGSAVTKKTFKSDKDGVVRVEFTWHRDAAVGGTWDHEPYWYVYVDDAQVASGSMAGSSGNVTSNADVAVSIDSVIDIRITGGEYYIDPTVYNVAAYVKDAYIKADVSLFTNTTVELN